MAELEKELRQKVSSLGGSHLKTKVLRELNKREILETVSILLALYDPDWSFDGRNSDAKLFKNVLRYLRVLDLGYLVKQPEDLQANRKLSRTLGAVVDKLERRHGDTLYQKARMLNKQLSAPLLNKKKSGSNLGKDGPGKENKIVKNPLEKKDLPLVTPIRRLLSDIKQTPLTDSKCKLLNGTPLAVGSELLGKELPRTPPSISKPPEPTSSDRTPDGAPRPIGNLAHTHSIQRGRHLSRTPGLPESPLARDPNRIPRTPMDGTPSGQYSNVHSVQGTPADNNAGTLVHRTPVGQNITKQMTPNSIPRGKELVRTPILDKKSPARTEPETQETQESSNVDESPVQEDVVREMDSSQTSSEGEVVPETQEAALPEPEGSPQYSPEMSTEAVAESQDEPASGERLNSSSFSSESPQKLDSSSSSPESLQKLDSSSSSSENQEEVNQMEESSGSNAEETDTESEVDKLTPTATQKSAVTDYSVLGDSSPESAPVLNIAKSLNFSTITQSPSVALRDSRDTVTNLQPLVVEKLKRTPCSTHNLKLSVAETVEVDVQESTAESEHSEPIHTDVIVEVNKAAGALAGYECQENDMAYLKRLQDEARIKKLQEERDQLKKMAKDLQANKEQLESQEEKTSKDLVMMKGTIESTSERVRALLMSVHGEDSVDMMSFTCGELERRMRQSEQQAALQLSKVERQVGEKHKEAAEKREELLDKICRREEGKDAHLEKRAEVEKLQQAKSALEADVQDSVKDTDKQQAFLEQCQQELKQLQQQKDATAMATAGPSGGEKKKSGRRLQRFKNMLENAFRRKKSQKKTEAYEKAKEKKLKETKKKKK